MLLTVLHSIIIEPDFNDKYDIIILHINAIDLKIIKIKKCIQDIMNIM